MTSAENIFENKLWKRTWLVEQIGLHEHRCGRHFASISWKNLATADTETFRGFDGKKIRPRLSRDQHRTFFNLVCKEWSKEYPDRSAKDSARRTRLLNRIIYVWYPLVTLGPCVACYLLFWIFGGVVPFESERSKIDRIFFVSVILNVVVWLYWKFFRRQPPQTVR